jgi:hypothetical protein
LPVFHSVKRDVVHWLRIFISRDCSQKMLSTADSHLVISLNV